MSDDLRARLAQAQAELVRAVTGRRASAVESTTAFDNVRVAAVARSLVNKRLQAVARTWPALAKWLGADFAPRFREFAARVAAPTDGGALTDGWRFHCQLSASVLPDAVGRERLWIGLHHAPTRTGLRPRRWPTIRCGWLPESRRILVGIFWPWPRRARIFG